MKNCGHRNFEGDYYMAQFVKFDVPEELANKALEALERVDTRILGLLLTRARGHDAGHYRYDYSYQPTTRGQGPVIEQISDAHEPPARAARRSDSWAVVG